MKEKVRFDEFSRKEYNPGNKMIRVAWYFTSSIFFKSGLSVSSKLKVFLLRIFKAKIGKGVIIKPKVNIKYPWFLVLGDHIWIGEEAWIDNLSKVTIGNNVCISQGAMILTGNHNYTKKTFDLIVEPVIIEDGVWVGAKAIICPGVVLKTHSVLTVGSVITGNAEPYGIYQGIPAVKIRERKIE